MGAIRNQVQAVGLVCLAACSFPEDQQDLRVNPTLYKDTGYQARVHADRTAFIAPMIDAREPVADASTGPYPRKFWPESIWQRPLLTMIEEIVVDELRDSGIFAMVQRSEPQPDTLIVTPYLNVAYLAEEEHPAGRKSMVGVELRVVVHGPGETKDGREILLDRRFREEVHTQVTTFPTPPTQLIGLALHKSVRKTLEILDQSNVARSFAPSDPSITGR